MKKVMMIMTVISVLIATATKKVIMTTGRNRTMISSTTLNCYLDSGLRGGTGTMCRQQRGSCLYRITWALPGGDGSSRAPDGPNWAFLMDCGPACRLYIHVYTHIVYIYIQATLDGDM